VSCITDFFLFLPLQVLCQGVRAGSAELAWVVHAFCHRSIVHDLVHQICLIIVHPLQLGEFDPLGISGFFFHQITVTDQSLDGRGLASGVVRHELFLTPDHAHVNSRSIFFCPCIDRASFPEPVRPGWHGSCKGRLCDVCHSLSQLTAGADTSRS
jgi:hypothetical protein